jgi:polyhydroxybutyrate depolymerase
MSQLRRALLPLAIVFGAVLIAAPPASARDRFFKFDVGGFQRTMTVFVPDRVARNARRPLPAVFVLHGALGTGSVVRRQLRMDDVARREGFIVVYPDGLRRGWNDGRTQRGLWRGRGGRANDVDFLTHAARRLIRLGIADPARIYLTGVSNGGMMSLRMACEAPPLFAGIAPVIASMPVGLSQRCRPERAVPMLLINGTADPLVPYFGGKVGFNGGLDGVMGEVLATAETVAFWRGVNGCSDRALHSRGPDKSPAHADSNTRGSTRGNTRGTTGGDPTRSEVLLYRDCRSGAPVALVRIEGGGHRIPGREDRRHPWLDRQLGPQSHDFETADVVWQFFVRPAGS